MKMNRPYNNYIFLEGLYRRPNHRVGQSVEISNAESDTQVMVRFEDPPSELESTSRYYIPHLISRGKREHAWLCTNPRRSRAFCEEQGYVYQ